MDEKSQDASTQQAKVNQQKYPGVHVAAVGLLLLLIGILFIIVLSAFNVKPVIQGTLNTGIDVFAILYVEAQFIERIIEPFSEKSLPQGFDLFGDTDAINDKQRQLKEEQDNVKAYSDEIKSLQISHFGGELSSISQEAIKRLQAKKKESNDKIDLLNRDIEGQSTKRVYSFWGLTSLMGMVLVYFSVGLFSTIGLSVQDVVVSGVTVLRGHALDAIISGVIVGAGTKPLHDLIGTLQKSSTQSSSGSSSQ